MECLSKCSVSCKPTCFADCVINTTNESQNNKPIEQYKVNKYMISIQRLLNGRRTEINGITGTESEYFLFAFVNNILVILFSLYESTKQSTKKV